MLPTFVVIGAARSGTTSLHHYLAQHPAIEMSAIKEPNFFLFEPSADGPRPVFDDRRMLAKSVRSLADYQRLWRDPTASARGEASPLYLYARETPALLAQALPDAKLVAVLREPVDRAFSHFSYVNSTIPHDELPGAFAAYVDTEADPSYAPYRSGTHFLRLGRYGEQVQRYLQHGPVERLLLLDSRDLSTQPGATLSRLCTFLGVDPDWRFATEVRYNPARSERSLLDRAVRPAVPYLKRALPPSLAGRLAARRQRLKAGPTPTAATLAPVLPQTRSRLDDYYRRDLALLRELTGFSF